MRSKSVNDGPLSAGDFAIFFEKKISGIRASTDGAAAPTFSDNTSDGRLLSFETVDVGDTVELIREMPMKQCAVDPIPTWLLKECIDLAVPSHRLNTYGRRAFAIAGPTTWNSLPTHLRHVENSTAAFGRLLKTFVF